MIHVILSLIQHWFKTFLYYLVAYPDLCLSNVKKGEINSGQVSGGQICRHLNQNF